MHTSPSDYATFNQIKSFYPNAFFEKSEVDIVIASVCPSGHSSVRYAISSLTIGQNSTKFGV